MSICRDILQKYFEQLDFTVINLALTAGGGADSTREKKVVELFKSLVAARCSEGAIVFIYISGIQVPFEAKPVSSLTR